MCVCVWKPTGETNSTERLGIEPLFKHDSVGHVKHEIFGCHLIKKMFKLVLYKQYKITGSDTFVRQSLSVLSIQNSS